MLGHIKKLLKRSTARGKTAALFMNFQEETYDPDTHAAFENAAYLTEDLRDLGIDPIWVARASKSHPVTEQCTNVKNFQRAHGSTRDSLSPIVKAQANDTVIISDRRHPIDKIHIKGSSEFQSALGLHLDTMGVDTLLVSSIMKPGSVMANLRASLLQDQFTIIAVADCINIPEAPDYKAMGRSVSLLSDDPALLRSQFALAHSDEIVKSLRPAPRHRMIQAEPLPVIKPAPPAPVAKPVKPDARLNLDDRIEPTFMLKY